MLLACTDLNAADTAAAARHHGACRGIQAWRLWEAINDWWDEIKTFIETRVKNARAKGPNTGIKHIKCTGRGYRNHHHLQMGNPPGFDPTPMSTPCSQRASSASEAHCEPTQSWWRSSNRRPGVHDGAGLGRASAGTTTVIG